MEQYDAMLASMQKERYVDQQVIFEQGSKPEAVYIITSGVVQCEYDPLLAAGRRRGGGETRRAALAPSGPSEPRPTPSQSVRVVYLPTSPYISLHLHVSVHFSLCISEPVGARGGDTRPYTSLDLPRSP